MSKFLCVPSLLVIVTVLIFASCSTTKTSVYIEELTQSSVKKSNNRLEQITNLWVGHFSNKGFVEKNKTQGNIEQEVIGRRIWRSNRVGEHWIYTGWFQAGSYESALSSSIAQISKISPDTSFITFYRIKEEVNIDDYEWRKDAPFDKLKRSDLESSGDGCGSYLVKRADGGYDAIANNPCYSPMSAELEYYKIDAKLEPTGITFNTKFLDRQFNTVIAYKDNVFLRFNKIELEKKYESLLTTN
jgi:hypothetical protein